LRALKLVWTKSPVGSLRTNKNLDLRVQLGLEGSPARPVRRARRDLRVSRAPRAQRVKRATPVHKGLPEPRVTRELKDLPDRLVRRETGATLGRKVR
jgi:hypothetical protein